MTSSALLDTSVEGRAAAAFVKVGVPEGQHGDRSFVGHTLAADYDLALTSHHDGYPFGTDVTIRWCSTALR